ncbi:hypothetical protein CPT03_10815 [Pedobacter ginsengisoli]|uniref:DUF3592 domain-containing protein n=1 Tax=Pedobacter ginsengisoli TaxID=363852 RepID=A0A2D1U5S0_9SPHI|nr:hypothetical protein [Pedobacter ginsengisoli]ATP56937.1 hypothetical protein CPT03_10815 [Pedobacter ginsengisoli]
MIGHLKLTVPSTTRTISTFVITAIILLCIYIAVFQPWYNSFKIHTPTLLMAGTYSLLALKNLWLDTSNMNWTRILFPGVIILIVGISAFGISKLQKIYYSYELANHGQTVVAKVDIVGTHDFNFFDGHKNYAVVRYKFNNKPLYKEVDNKGQKLIKGETIMLRLSTQHPHIIEVVDIISFLP